MSAPKVYIVCSFDKGLQRLAECVRRDYPQAHITVIAHRGHTLTEGEAKHIDTMVHSSSGTLSAIGGAWGLVTLAREVRRQKPEAVVLQFESIKLRLFGIVCGPRRLSAWLGNGQRLEMPLSVGANLGDLWRHRLRGYGAMARAGWHAHVLGMASEKPERRR